MIWIKVFQLVSYQCGFLIRRLTNFNVNEFVWHYNWKISNPLAGIYEKRYSYYLNFILSIERILQFLFNRGKTILLFNTVLSTALHMRYLIRKKNYIGLYIALKYFQHYVRPSNLSFNDIILWHGILFLVHRLDCNI